MADGRWQMQRITQSQRQREMLFLLQLLCRFVRRVFTGCVWRRRFPRKIDDEALDDLDWKYWRNWSIGLLNQWFSDWLIDWLISDFDWFIRNTFLVRTVRSYFCIPLLNNCRQVDMLTCSVKHVTINSSLYSLNFFYLLREWRKKFWRTFFLCGRVKMIRRKQNKMRW